MLLETKHLILIASPKEWVNFALSDLEEFSEMVDAKVPTEWPTKEAKAGATQVLAEMPNDDENAIGWWLWWALEKPKVKKETPDLVGFMGFKGPPNETGTVELNYSMVPSFKEPSLVSEALGAISDWAFRSSGVKKIAAATSAGTLVSKEVLAENHFKPRADSQGTQQVYELTWAGHMKSKNKK